LRLDGKIGSVCQTAFVIDRRIDGKPDLHTEAVILQTMSGSDVHESRTGGIVHKIGIMQFAGALAERMFVFDLGQLSGIETSNDLVIFPAHLLHQSVQQSH